MRNVDLARLVPGPDVWELDAPRYPAWIFEGRQPAYRPWIGWCMSRTRSKQISMGPSRPGESRAFMALLVLTRMLRNSPFKIDKPATILMRDRALLEQVAPCIDGSGVRLELVDALPLVDQGMARVAANHPDPVPEGYLPDIDRELLHEYAHAACEYAEAMPWLTLNDENLIAVSPSPDDMFLASVSGSTKGSRGICFWYSADEHLRFTADPDSRDDIANVPRWLWTISTGLHVPGADLDRWDELGLPRIDGRDFPLLEQLGGDDEDGQPGPERVEFMIGLLRALADIGRRGIDGAPMHKLVRGFRGPVRVTLSVSELVRKKT
jgi:hypothetical protein